MRLTEAQRAANHERILRVAATLFRERGVDGVGIDKIMEAAGLTHGAFYGHFPSKAALIAAAGAYAQQDAGRTLFEGDDGDPTGGIAALIRRYLSTSHRDHPGRGCAVAGFGADIGRQDKDAQQVFAQGLEELLGRIAARLPGSREQARRDAIATFAAMIGAVVMARSVGDVALSSEVLDTVRQKLEAEASASE